ncbi:unnamed protein product [Nezara viridula]|uniref:Uncharacterized protein n=1 Tax=Nezara viridula TaxID=85310 RepID=A0A9P0E942_NEZVI|nr:unnamed protein product [Nezara viridula]
MTFVEIKE